MFSDFGKSLQTFGDMLLQHSSLSKRKPNTTTYVHQQPLSTFQFFPKFMGCQITEFTTCLEFPGEAT